MVLGIDLYAFLPGAFETTVPAECFGQTEGFNGNSQADNQMMDCRAP